MVSRRRAPEKVAKHYVVLSPRGGGAAGGVPTINDERQRWYEGDVFIPGPKTNIEELLELGLIKEV